MIPGIVFAVIFITTIIIFTRKVRSVSRNIRLGKSLEIKDNKPRRWAQMVKVAIGQLKMTRRPIPAVLHLFVYVGFIIVNIEMLEILIDGLSGSHRIFSFIGDSYGILISAFEIFGVAVMFGCLIFLIRRNIIRLKRFWSKEMTLWPRSDANIILITELFLMSAILTMNATDGILQARAHAHYPETGSFLISGMIQPLYSGMSDGSLVFLERFSWWFHITGVFAFLNYIPYSKHFHVFLAFPNVYYSRLEPKGKMTNMPAITKEIKSMLAGTTGESAQNGEELGLFGAKDVKDFTWKHLMDAFTCTECGRCTSSCPANITGKKLSPRKVVMDLRDRVEYLGKQIKKHGPDFTDDISLFDRITSEELWACTTCNACTEECPVNIDPLSIILEMRRYLVMEKASAPAGLNSIFSNIENNGAPWQFSTEDRLVWIEK